MKKSGQGGCIPQYEGERGRQDVFDRREERDTLHGERVVDVFVRNHHDDT